MMIQDSDFESFPPLGPDYRQEVVQFVARCIGAGDSCSIVGISGTGKSNLFRYLLKPEMRRHYLGDAWQSYLFINVDSHALGEVLRRAMYESLLGGLISEAQTQNLDKVSVSKMQLLREQMVGITDSTAWQRAFCEVVATVMTVDRTRRLVFLFDQFDEVYTKLNPRFFANLRAIRDEHKYRVSFVTFTRDVLPRLCQTPACEEFYELFSPNVVGLGPYDSNDAWILLRRVAGRYRLTLDPALGNRLIALCGGHPGLLRATCMAVVRSNSVLPETAREDVRTLLEDADVRSECLKLWDSLGTDEQEVLSDIAAESRQLRGDEEALRLLELKCLVTRRKDGTRGIFSVIVEFFVGEIASAGSMDLRFDKTTGQVWVGGKAMVQDLTKLEFLLLCLLYDRGGEVCNRDEIINTLYPDEICDPNVAIPDSRVDTLVGRLREKIEPDRSSPRFIVSVRGRGYRLCTGDPNAG